MNKSAHWLTSGDPDRRRYVSYLLGAVVPLLALAFMIGRYTALQIGSMDAGLGVAPLGAAHVVGFFICISSITFTCLLLLRQFIRRSIREIGQLAQFDALTGLPNRRTFKDRVEQALLHARRRSALFAICFIDLDEFQRVNDTLGHSVGDQLLCDVTKRLSGIVRFSDSVSRATADDTQMGVARLEGDEFTLLLTDISDSIDADRVARRVLEVLRAPFQVAGHELLITASLGIAVYPIDGDDVETLQQKAETAMHRAKKMGRNNCKFFTASMNDESARKLNLEERLRGAMSRDELSVHYQPVRDAETGQVLAAEALVRWDDADLGSVAPEEFIPIAEDAGLIDPIGEWVLRTACAQSQTWQAAGLLPIRMAVNVSGNQVRKPGFVDTVARTLEETELSAAHLELEITESTIMQNDKLIDAAFAELSDMGIGLALDDFGTGYSSLTYLRRFPISRVKVDHSFVEGLPDNAENLAVTGAIISMAHHLKMSVVGEGVETEEEAQSLRELECEELQGFLFSPPVCAEEFVRFLDQEKKKKKK
jgi:diguanylate cyclase (GGDEF)-like protein